MFECEACGCGEWKQGKLALPIPQTLGGGKSMGNVGMMRTSDLREEKNDRLTPIHRNLELM